MHYRQSDGLFKLLAWFRFWVKNNWLTVVSVYHAYVDNQPIGQLPHVCALLKEVFNQLPPHT